MAGTADPTETPDSGNVWLEGILWGTEWSSGSSPTTVSFYIAGQDGPEAVTLDQSAVTALTPYEQEVEAMLRAMAALEAVANIDFQAAGSQADADIIWAMASDADAEGALGWANPPGTETNSALGDEQSLIVSNQEAYDPGPGAADFLAVGGFDFITFIHELGHAVGLAHPHDRGGDSTVFPGVSEPFDDYGAFEMNQGVFTMMSYNDGWPGGPLGPSPDPTYGFEGGPMALDIASLQFIYGANMEYRTGDDSYALPDANEVGTYYSCLWDAGGEDRILGTGGEDIIDLRSASLEFAPGGGGFVSYAAGIFGGFTIAVGAIIEAALGGEGADSIKGNAFANALAGSAGDDDLWGGDGADEVAGGDGADRLRGGNDDDTLTGGDGQDLLSGEGGSDAFVFKAAPQSAAGARDGVTDFTQGEDVIDLAAIDADASLAGNQAFALDAGGGFTAGEIRQVETAAGLVLQMNLDDDRGAEMAILLAGLQDPLGADSFVL